MADPQTDSRQDWRLWPIVLCGVMSFAAFASKLPDAVAQVGPALTRPLPAVNGPAGPSPTASLDAASPADTVVDVQIAGNKSLALDKILPNIHTRVGRAFDLEQIEEDVRRLDHTHQFINVRTFWQKVPGGRRVIFEVIERPMLQEVKFVGLQVYPHEDAEKRGRHQGR